MMKSLSKLSVTTLIASAASFALIVIIPQVLSAVLNMFKISSSNAFATSMFNGILSFINYGTLALCAVALVLGVITLFQKGTVKSRIISIAAIAWGSLYILFVMLLSAYAARYGYL